ncbi:MAG: YfcE family phosphodiesterase [Clostridia bacterium]|nr:YfcE family phosphodiesterase [Clostridia bacterium]
MRILVISDSHGRTSAIEQAIEAQPNANHIFFLGDCISDIEDLTYIYPDKSFHIVTGNCDGYSFYKSIDFITLSGKKIIFTHGHTLSVKSGLERLKTFGETEDAHIILFGHTHTAIIEYENERYFVNPGSLSHGSLGFRSYAVIDIEENGIKPIIVKI